MDRAQGFVCPPILKKLSVVLNSVRNLLLSYTKCLGGQHGKYKPEKGLDSKSAKLTSHSDNEFNL